MKFMSQIECESFAKRLGRTSDLLDHKKLSAMKKRFDFLYESRLKNAEKVAATIASCCEPFSDVLLWTHSLIWGDRTQETGAPADWSNYGAWRRQQGAPASLSDLPGQLFEAGEQRELVQGIKWTILTGSDAILIPLPTRMLAHLTHDDLISLHCRSAPAGLHNLESLGLRRITLP